MFRGQIVSVLVNSIVAMLAVVFQLTLASTAARAEHKLALVVGNNNYANLPADQQLHTAVNDAREIGNALERIGFEVVRGENLGRQQMIDLFDRFSHRLAPGDVAAFFFAGHGVSIGGGNYILPTDMPNIEAGQDVRLARTALGETDIVADLQARGVRAALVILDACRNNPFRKPGVRGVGSERGLTRTEPVRGVFTLYSAGIGQTALDRLDDTDKNPNSVFTRILAPALTRPDIHLGDLAVEVREQVARLADTVHHEQRPAYYDELVGGKFYLAGLSKAPAAPPPAMQAPAAPVPVAPVAAPEYGTTKPVPASSRQVRVLIGHEDPVMVLCFSSDSRRLASASLDGTTRLWNLETAQPLASLRHTERTPSSAHFTSNDKRLLTSFVERGFFSIYDMERDRNEGGAWLAFGSGTTISTFTPDGRYIAFSSAKNVIQIFRALMNSSNQAEKTIRGKFGTVTAFAFSGDGRRLLSASADKTLRLWDPDAAAAIRSIPMPGQIGAIALSPDATRIAAATGNAVTIFDADTGKPIRELNGHLGPIVAIAFSPDGQRLASAGADKTARLWDVATGTLLKTWEGHTDALTALAYSPDGQWVATGARDFSIRVWPVDTESAVAGAH